jgi:hypothetical protein
MAARDVHAYLAGEMEKLARKGVWLRDESGMVTRAQWFQAIGCDGREVVFQFSAPVLKLIAALEPGEAETQLVRGIQYKGKHTLAVFDIIWAASRRGWWSTAFPS